MYIALSLKTFALSMIGIFIPIFLVAELGLSFFDVAIFYLIHGVSYLFFSPFAGKIASTWGLCRAAIAAIPLYMVFYLGLYNLSTIGIPIHYFAILLGITECLFGLPFGVHFVRSSDKKHRSEEVGFLFTCSILSSVMGPLIGGLLIVLYGFNVLFTVVALFLFLSIIPMMLTRDYHVSSRLFLATILNCSVLKGTMIIIWATVPTIVNPDNNGGHCKNDRSNQLTDNNVPPFLISVSGGFFSDRKPK